MPPPQQHDTGRLAGLNRPVIPEAVHRVHEVTPAEDGSDDFGAGRFSVDGVLRRRRRADGC